MNVWVVLVSERSTYIFHTYLNKTAPTCIYTYTPGSMTLKTFSISSWSTFCPNKSFTQIKQRWLNLTHYVDTVMKAWGWGWCPRILRLSKNIILSCFILYFHRHLIFVSFHTKIWVTDCATASQQGFTMVVCALKAGLLAGWLTVFWGPKFDLLLASQSISNATH